MNNKELEKASSRVADFLYPYHCVTSVHAPVMASPKYAESHDGSDDIFQNAKLRPLMHKPLAEAAQLCGMKPTQFKKRCRERGLSRRPAWQLKSMRALEDHIFDDLQRLWSTTRGRLAGVLKLLPESQNLFAKLVGGDDNGCGADVKTQHGGGRGRASGKTSPRGGGGGNGDHITISDMETVPLPQVGVFESTSGTAVVFNGVGSVAPATSGNSDTNFRVNGAVIHSAQASFSGPSRLRTANDGLDAVGEGAAFWDEDAKPPTNGTNGACRVKEEMPDVMEACGMTGVEKGPHDEVEELEEAWNWSQDSEKLVLWLAVAHERTRRFQLELMEDPSLETPEAIRSIRQWYFKVKYNQKKRCDV